MTALFRLSGTHRRSPVIDAWFRQNQGELGRLARRWYGEMRGCGREVLEVLHDGCPTACIDDAAFGYVAAFREHVNVGFFRGSELPDPDGLLLGTGRLMRHVKVRPGGALNSGALKKLIVIAYEDMKARVEAEAGEPRLREKHRVHRPR